MNSQFLQLYKPLTRIEFSWNLNDAKENLLNKGFSFTKDENKSVVYGKGLISKNNNLVLHLYFNKLDNNLNHIMMHYMRSYTVEKITDSYNKNEIWLTEYYGQPTLETKNQIYNIFHTIRVSKFCKIEHFIKDRFGDEEAVSIEIFDYKTY